MRSLKSKSKGYDGLGYPLSYYTDCKWKKVMWNPRYAAKTDINQTGIVKILRQIPGLTVACGHDDILLGYQGRTYWYEIKQPTCRKHLKDSQKKLLAGWRGHYRVVTSVDEILQDLG